MQALWAGDESLGVRIFEADKDGLRRQTRRRELYEYYRQLKDNARIISSDRNSSGRCQIKGAYNPKKYPHQNVVLAGL
jgi:hypothetical protein